jgi:ligand-binding sensor domain-containing protein/signal transduction histidine kinase
VREPIFLLLVWALFAWSASSHATVLWSDLGSTLAHETGDGSDILNGALKRDDSSADALYFKFHVDPLSDASTEEYFAAFELYEGGEERLGIGNALKAWAYSAFKGVAPGAPGGGTEYIDLHSSRPEPGGPGTVFTYENPHRGLESTIVFKVQYVAGGEDHVTVWLNPDLGPGASESSQPLSLITEFDAVASFDEIRLRHSGGGNGWIFSEIEIATSFSDFTAQTGKVAGAEGLGLGLGELPFTFRSWLTEQGLPQNFVRALAQTRDGCLWVGADDGVARFDGLRFVSFGMREGLHSGPVRTLLGDSHGALWIGGAGGGLTRLEEGSFTTFTSRDGLPAGSVTALAEDKDQRIWVGTENGLAILESGRLSIPASAEEFRGKRITALFKDSKGGMWLGAARAGVFHLERNQFLAVRDVSVDELLRDPHCVLVDKQGRLWVGAGEDMVLHLDGKRWRPYRIPRHQSGPHVCALTEDPEGTVWAGSAGEGLFRFQGGKTEVISARSGLSDNLIECLLMDQEGVLWVGSHGGLNRLRSKNLFVFGQKEGLGHGPVHGLAEVLPGVIWAGTSSDGLYASEGRTFGRLTPAGLSLGGPQVNSLLTARDGSCWAACAKGILHFKEPANAAAQAELFALGGLNVISLAEDNQGTIWVGTREGELWQLQQGKWSTQTNFWQSQPVTAVVPTQNRGVFIGTDGGGLVVCAGHAQSCFDKSKGLLSDLVRTLYLDPQGSLWIGTAGGGLSRWADGHVTTFTSREGLPDNTISQILEDDAGRLWLGSNRGIACVNKHELEQLAAGKLEAVYPQVYGPPEGMVSEECTGGSYPAGLKTKSGLLWFSTLKGIVAVDTRLRVGEVAPPPVLLEEVLVDGIRSASFRMMDSKKQERSQLGQGEPVPDPLRISPGRHRLEFVYSAVSFDAAQRVRFRYQLERLDPDWVPAGTRRSAFYNYVPPGKYLFRVTACTSDGVWNDAGATLALNVLPHFWQTLWFLGITGGLVLVSVVWGVRVIEKRKLQARLKRLEQEKMLERERTRIAQDLHDEMGAKLCRISFLSEHARRSQELPVEMQQQITAISDDSREVLHSLDEIVWAVNPQNDTLEHVASYIGQYAQDYFQETGIVCELDIPAQIPAHPLSSQLRHHLFLAVHEAFTNILKHSGATRASVTIQVTSSMAEIVVRDNGKSFVLPDGNGDSASDSGNGLRNMRRRLTDIGGRCEFEAKPGSGTTVRFIFPLSQPVPEVAT